MRRIQELNKPLQRRVKRLCDIVFSILGMVILSPVWLIVAFIVRRTIPGSVLFHQTRVGYKGRKFRILKFRTMDADSAVEEESGDPPDADRIPSTGWWLRRLKLDELPQLVNIFAGDMSFIGPRPYIEKESRGLAEERYDMRPGLTGLAQVYGNRELGWDERTAYDIEYVRTFHLGLDFKILLWTVLVIVFGEKACLKHKKNPCGIQ